MQQDYSYYSSAYWLTNWANLLPGDYMKQGNLYTKKGETWIFNQRTVYNPMKYRGTQYLG